MAHAERLGGRAAACGDELAGARSPDEQGQSARAAALGSGGDEHRLLLDAAKGGAADADQADGGGKYLGVERGGEEAKAFARLAKSLQQSSQANPC